jgi:hypothetical protein
MQSYTRRTGQTLLSGILLIIYLFYYYLFYYYLFYYYLFYYSTLYSTQHHGYKTTFHLKAASEVERQKWVTSLELAKHRAIKAAEAG